MFPHPGLSKGRGGARSNDPCEKLNPLNEIPNVALAVSVYFCDWKCDFWFNCKIDIMQCDRSSTTLSEPTQLVRGTLD